METNNQKQVDSIISKTLYPNFASELSLSATGVVNGIVAGYFYGKVGIAAIGIGTPILSVFTILAGLVGTGNTVLCSRINGEGASQRFRRMFSLSVLWALLLSFVATTAAVFGRNILADIFSGADHADLLASVADYIYAFSLGAPFIIFRQLLIPMVNIEGGYRQIHFSSFLVLFMDVIFSYIFSAWFDAGTFGLGAACTCSYIFGTLPLFAFCLKRPTLRLSFAGCFSWQDSLALFKAGFPTAVKRICNVAAPILNNRFVIAVAGLGGMAALSVQISATRFLLCLVLALSTSFLLVAASFYGEGDRKQMEMGIRGMFRQAVFWSGLFAALFFIFAEELVAFFLYNEPEIAELAAFAIRCYAVGVPFMALNQCAASYLQATKRLKASNAVITADRFVVLVLTVYSLGYIFGEKGIFAAYGVSEMILTLILYAILCLKNKKLVTSFEDMTLLPKDFGVSPDHYLSGSFRSKEEVVGFSEKVQSFCLKCGVDRTKALSAAICVEELAVNIVTYGIKSPRENVTVRIFIRSGGDLVIRFRDNGKPFNIEEQHRLAIQNADDPAKNIGIRMVFAMAREFTYNASYSMNNTVIIL